MRSLRQLKDMIKNVANDKKLNSQVLLRNYMMERLLERISLSKYKKNFILKGGMLVSSFVGIESRMTVDMDTTMKNKALSITMIDDVLQEIMSLDIEDGVSFTLEKIDEIRDEADYSGYRVSIESKLDTARIPIKIDVTTGDKITPIEELHQYKLFLENRTIEIYAYNIETVLAEKLETIISRNVTNTRMRDFYDIYILLHVLTEKINVTIFRDALLATAESRGTIKFLSNGKKVIEEVLSDDVINTHWIRYQRKYEYAKGVPWELISESLDKLWLMYSND